MGYQITLLIFYQGSFRVIHANIIQAMVNDFIRGIPEMGSDGNFLFLI